MVRVVYLGTISCLVFLSTVPTFSQTLNKPNSGFTAPEAIQVVGHASGNIPFGDLKTVSAQDVNGDGKMDLLVTGVDPLSNSQALTTTLLRNTGSQNFQQVVGNNSSYCLPVYSDPVTFNAVPPFCTLADLNGDKLPDKIYAGEYPGINPLEVDYPYIKVQLATGAGTYGAATKYALGGKNSYIISVATGDFNGDGRMDIAALRMSQIPDPNTTGIQGYLIILLANRGGGFTISQTQATGVFNFMGHPPMPSDFIPKMRLTVLDLNGDGKSDILVDGGGFGVFLGTPSGVALQPPGNFIGNPFALVMAADLNHDGFGDLVVVESPQTSDQELHVLYGGGAGSQFYGYFSRDQILTLNEYGGSVVNMVAADFNRDGRPDLAISTLSNINIFTQRADGSFSFPRQYPAASGQIASLLVADFNGDGKLDLASGGSNPLLIYYGDGYGSFTGPPITSDVFPGALFGSGNIVTADFNRDGKADIATTTAACSQGICYTDLAIFAGSGQGWFLAPKHYKIAGPASVMALGDVNGDGIADLVGINTFGGQGNGQADTGVMLGKPGGTFATGNAYTLQNSGVDLYLRDVNNDHKLDLVTDVGVSLGKGDGTFSTVIPFPFPYSPGCASCVSTAVGDFNHDGKLDVIYAESASVHVLLGDGTGHFSVGQSFSFPCSLGCGTPIVAVGDLNGDGKLDFVAGVTAELGGAVAKFYGNGDGTFRAGETGSIMASAPSPIANQIFSLTIHDFNGDGINDIAVQASGGILAVFLGSKTGKLTLPVLFSIGAGNFGNTAFAIADFNSDGTPDVALPTGSGFERILNTGYKTWPAVSSLPPAPPFRTP